MIAIYQKGNFTIVSTNTKDDKKVIFEDRIDQNEVIVDCKKLKNNVIGVITKNIEILYFIKYVSDQ